MKSKLKNFFPFLLIIIATLFVLYFSLKDDYDVILNTIFNINKVWFLIAFLLLFVYYFLKSYVIQSFAREFNGTYSMKDAFRLTIETNFFHAITPFAVGGQPYEVYSLTKHKINFIDATNTSIECFIVYQIALVFLGMISILYNQVFHVLNSSILNHLLTLGFVINFLVTVILFWLTLSKKTEKNVIYKCIDLLGKIKLLSNREEKKESIHKYLIKFNNGSKLLLKNKSRFFIMIGIQLLSLICLYLIPLALCYGIGYNGINPFVCILTMSYVMLIGSFVPIPGGTGGLEYGFIVLFGNFINSSKLNAIMLLWRFITYYFGMILGAIILNVKGDQK